MKKAIMSSLPLLIVALAFSPVTGFKISGKITDHQGNPMQGVIIKIKGESTATTSAKDGIYTIEARDSKVTLVFSAVGYQATELPVNGKAILDVVMEVSKNDLGEVVVMSSKRIAENSSIQIRGIASISAPFTNNQALYGSTSGVQRKVKSGSRYQIADDKDEEYNTEGYDNITENRFLKSAENPLSTFSIDVDAASYSNVRRFLTMGQLPPAGAVRVEEMINYFHYEYPAPGKDNPFSVNTEISDCPWNSNNKLVLVGLQGKKIPMENLPPSNIVFLIDVSGSMMEPQKLPLVQSSMKMLVDQLREQDHVAMVVYAGAAGLVLPPTSGNEKQKIKDAIDRLEAGGSTAGGAGIKLAYKTAIENFKKEGNNRVILCTDGDFNIGASSDDDMERLIEKERKSGVFLTVLGYGMGNYKDSKMQKLADKGNGNHAYIDGINEARKVLVSEFGGTLFTIAKDVKLQIEFNPAKVQAYRLVGYENRILNKEDFNNDRKDAGDMGSGHTVTALYEIIPIGVQSDFLESVDPLKYQSGKTNLEEPSTHNGEIMNIKLRYKQPDADISRLIEHPVYDNRTSVSKTSDNFRFAAAVAEFGMLLRNSEFKSNASFNNVLNLAVKAKGHDEEGYRAEFIRLVESARSLAGNVKGTDDEDVSVRND